MKEISTKKNKKRLIPLVNKSLLVLDKTEQKKYDDMVKKLLGGERITFAKREGAEVAKKAKITALKKEEDKLLSELDNAYNQKMQGKDTKAEIQKLEERLLEISREIEQLKPPSTKGKKSPSSGSSKEKGEEVVKKEVSKKEEKKDKPSDLGKEERETQSVEKPRRETKTAKEEERELRRLEIEDRKREKEKERTPTLLVKRTAKESSPSSPSETKSEVSQKKEKTKEEGEGTKDKQKKENPKQSKENKAEEPKESTKKEVVKKAEESKTNQQANTKAKESDPVEETVVPTESEKTKNKQTEAKRPRARVKVKGREEPSYNKEALKKLFINNPKEKIPKTNIVLGEEVGGSSSSEVKRPRVGVRVKGKEGSSYYKKTLKKLFINHPKEETPDNSNIVLAPGIGENSLTEVKRPRKGVKVKGREQVPYNKGTLKKLFINNPKEKTLDDSNSVLGAEIEGSSPVETTRPRERVKVKGREQVPYNREALKKLFIKSSQKKLPSNNTSLEEGIPLVQSVQTEPFINEPVSVRTLPSPLGNSSPLPVNTPSKNNSLFEFLKELRQGLADYFGKNQKNNKLPSTPRKSYAGASRGKYNQVKNPETGYDIPDQIPNTKLTREERDMIRQKRAGGIDYGEITQRMGLFKSHLKRIKF